MTAFFLLIAWFVAMILVAMGGKPSHSLSYREQKAHNDLLRAKEKYRKVHEETIETNKQLRKTWEEIKSYPRRRWQHLMDEMRRLDEINEANKARIK